MFKRNAIVYGHCVVRKGIIHFFQFESEKSELGRERHTFAEKKKGNRARSGLKGIKHEWRWRWGLLLRKSGLKKDVARWSNSTGRSDIEVALGVSENVA